jgi:hypothetical protein
MAQIRFLSLLLFIALSLSAQIIAQEDNYWCGTDPRVIENVGELRNTTWTLKILLAEFQDVKHKLPGYTYTNFNNLFFSSGIYVSPNMYSPDDQQVFGSMRDYLYIMSDGDFTLNGYVVNIDENRDGIPDWLTLPNTKMNYSTQGGFISAVYSAANSAGLDITTNSTTKLAIIYAGHTYRSVTGSYSYLNPRAEGLGGRWYINGELFACCPHINQKDPMQNFLK